MDISLTFLLFDKKPSLYKKHLLLLSKVLSELSPNYSIGPLILHKIVLFLKKKKKVKKLVSLLKDTLPEFNELNLSTVLPLRGSLFTRELNILSSDTSILLNFGWVHRVDVVSHQILHFPAVNFLLSADQKDDTIFRGRLQALVIYLIHNGLTLEECTNHLLIKRTNEQLEPFSNELSKVALMAASTSKPIISLKREMISAIKNISAMNSKDLPNFVGLSKESLKDMSDMATMLGHPGGLAMPITPKGEKELMDVITKLGLPQTTKETLSKSILSQYTKPPKEGGNDLQDFLKHQNN